MERTKPRILMSAFSDLVTDQRIEKVCNSLHQHGYELTLIGTSWRDKRPVERPYRVQRITLHSQSLRMAYVEFQAKLYKTLQREISRHDVLHAHDIDAILPNVWIKKKTKVPLFFDSHELFTEMPALQGKWTKTVWQWVERYGFKHVDTLFTESDSYAHWLEERYGKKAIVLRNLPLYKGESELQTSGASTSSEKPFLLYQGALNPSRGLESMIEAMTHLPDVTLKIAGGGPIASDLKKLAMELGVANRVEFLGVLTPLELKKLTPQAALGLSLEENGGVSYLYSLPNKVGDYIQGRIPILTIDFPEFQRIHQQFEVGDMLSTHNPKEIAERAKTILAKGKAFYLDELNRAARHLCWEQDEKKLIEAYAQWSTRNRSLNNA